MEITEVRIKLVHESQDRLLAFCSVTLDASFVVRDLKIIQGTRGPFVAMPSRKLMDRCRRCGCKNALRSSYCNQCGVRLPENRAPKENDGRAKLYADIAHPINTDCRERIQQAVIRAFEEEVILSQQPGYICRYEDYGENEGSLPDEFREIDFEIGTTLPRTAAGEQRRVEPPAATHIPPPHAPAARESESVKDTVAREGN
jgi:stage V sporulation protein G